MDKSAELEQRLLTLEEKLKVIFTEIDKRFQEQQEKHPEYSFEDRMQEIEDLLLLLQLETTKLREKTGEGLDFGLSPQVPDVSARLNRIEEELASKSTPAVSHSIDAHSSDVEARMSALEESLKTRAEPAHEDVKELEKRIRTLEALLERRGRHEIEEAESNLLDDIQKILKH